MRAEERFNRIWYGQESPAVWMRVLAMFYRAVVAVRRALYRSGALRQTRVPVPVIVIGNITAGGTGKTPLTIHLVEQLRMHGLKAGVVSRGYGGRPGDEPLPVIPETPSEHAGDEPVLIARRTGAPVVVHARRARAAQRLVEMRSVDVIVCDDGLQHYALARDLEIAVVDGARGLGNRLLLPAGPLREPAKRLDTVDYVVRNGAATSPVTARDIVMTLEPVALVNLRNGERRAPDAFASERCVAIAGTGNPQRFFTTLGDLGYAAECRAFRDHHAFVETDLAFAGERVLLMTEKDAVKCQAFARDNWWYLEVAARLNEDIAAGIIERLDLKSLSTAASDA